MRINTRRLNTESVIFGMGRNKKPEITSGPDWAKEMQGWYAFVIHIKDKG